MSTNSHYIIRGTGTPFFFQHGLGGDCQQPQALLKDLDNIQLISMDSRGHGETPLNHPNQISFNQFADDVIDLSNYLNISQFILGGISMGAGISLNIAIRYPERVRALILARPAWLHKGHPENLHLFELLAELINKQQGETIVNLKEFKELESKEYNAAQAVLKQLTRKQPEHTAYLLQTMIADKPFQNAEQLNKINVPTLLLCSHEDFFHPYHYGLILQENIRHSIFKEVPSRYLNNDLYEKAVLYEVKDFLKQNQLLSIL
jgi:pimeloyl-ACP methyl ester carboxylesterase